MNRFKVSPSFKEKFQGSLLWTALSIIADLIAIWTLITTQQTISTQTIYSPPSAPLSEFKFFGVITITDAIILTGLFTLFIIVSIAYLSINLSKSKGDLWPIIWGTFLISAIIWFYFRIWLGEYGLIWILSALSLICGIITYSLFKIMTQNIYRVGGILITTFFGVTTIFLLFSTNALSNINSNPNSPQMAQQDVLAPNQYPQVVVPFVAPTPTIITENNNLPKLIPPISNNFVSYELPPEIWFPAPSDIRNGLFAGNVDEVTNENVPNIDTDTLKLHQSWGRITSYERRYSHQDGCNSSDLKSIYIQIIFFQSSDGSMSFFDWANEDGKFLSDIGNNAYLYYKDNISEEGCLTDKISINFQRYNVVTRSQFRFVDGKMDYGTMESLSLKIAHLIDDGLKAQVK